MHISLLWTYICLWAHTCHGTHVEVKGQSLMSVLTSILVESGFSCLSLCMPGKVAPKMQGFCLCHSSLWRNGRTTGAHPTVWLFHEFWATNWGLLTYAASTWLIKPPFQPQHDIFIHAYDFSTTFITITFSDYEVIISGQQEFLHMG